MEKMTKFSFWTLLLWILLLGSLALNGFILYTLDRTRQETRELLNTARTALNALHVQAITTVVNMDQQFPISDTIPISQTFHVPIDMTYPLATRVNTTVQIPILGPQQLNIPINAQIPIQMELDVPIQSEFPFSYTYRIQTELPVEFTLPAEFLEPIDEILQQAEAIVR